MYDKLSIIKMIIEDGLSLREVSRITKRDRKIVTKYYKEYLKLNEKLDKTTCKKEIRSIQNEIINQPTYPKRKVVYRKWNDEINIAIYKDKIFSPKLEEFQLGTFSTGALISS